MDGCTANIGNAIARSPILEASFEKRLTLLNSRTFKKMACKFDGQLFVSGVGIEWPLPRVVVVRFGHLSATQANAMIGSYPYSSGHPRPPSLSLLPMALQICLQQNIQNISKDGTPALAVETSTHGILNARVRSGAGSAGFQNFSFSPPHSHSAPKTWRTTVPSGSQNFSFPPATAPGPVKT